MFSGVEIQIWACLLILFSWVHWLPWNIQGLLIYTLPTRASRLGPSSIPTPVPKACIYWICFLQCLLCGWMLWAISFILRQPFLFLADCNYAFSSTDLCPYPPSIWSAYIWKMASTLSDGTILCGWTLRGRGRCDNIFRENQHPCSDLPHHLLTFISGKFCSPIIASIVFPAWSLKILKFCFWSLTTKHFSLIAYLWVFLCF